MDDPKYQDITGLSTDEQRSVCKFVEGLRRERSLSTMARDRAESCGSSPVLGRVLGEKMPTYNLPPTSRSFAQPHGIGWAIEQLYNSRIVGRAGWNGKGMWIALQLPPDGSQNTLPYVFIVTVDGERVPWLASQTDLLANDWQLL